MSITTDLASRQAIPCLAEHPEYWFADTHEGIEYAKSLCADCPLQQVCLDGALERGEPWGVWGGELFERGRVIPRKRARGRPRLDRVHDR